MEAEWYHEKMQEEVKRKEFNTNGALYWIIKLSKPGDAKLESRYVTGMMDGALYIWNNYKLETVERAHVKANAKSAVTAMYSHNDAFFKETNKQN